MNYAIEIRRLNKKFFERKSLKDVLSAPFKKRYSRLVLSDVDLSIERGCLFCLIGPNGAGKTTLIKIISTLILPTSGKVLVDGVDIEKDETGVKRVIGVVTGEERSFFWRLSGRENLRFFASLYNIYGKEADKRISEVLEITGINEPKKRYQEYSTGMKQRLAIARSILGRPAILLMDEPTGGLDPISSERLKGFIKERLCRELETTILFTTHHLSEIEGFADRIAIIDKGVIKALGSLGELRAEAGNSNASLLEVYRRYVNS